MLDQIIDLSHFNNVTDFNLLRQSGICAIIHKATQGSEGTDPHYVERRTAAREAGLLWGAYHFGNGSDAISAQVKHFLTVSDTPLRVLDVEHDPEGKSMSLAQAEDFVTQVFNSTGRWPGLYCGHDLKQELVGVRSTVLSNCWLWYAEYGVEHPAIPTPWSQWSMWQYTDSGKADGITGSCDRDRFNGDMDRLQTLFGHQEPTQPNPSK